MVTETEENRDTGERIEEVCTEEDEVGNDGDGREEG